MDSIVTEVPAVPLESVLAALQPDALRPLRGDELYHLERLLRMAWRLMTPAQRACFSQSSEVAALLKAKGKRGQRRAVTLGIGQLLSAVVLPDGRVEAVPPLFRLVG